MLQYKNFKFNDKQDFVGYIKKRTIDYWKNHNNSFSNVCEKLDSKKYFNSVSYSEVFEKLIDDYVNVFAAHYDYAYHILFNDIYDIMNIYDEDEIQENMNDDYYEYLFEDDEDFFLNIYDEDEIQENMNDDYYEYLFEDDEDFFSDDDLDE